MKQHLLAIRLGCSGALLLVLTTCGLPNAEPTLPSSAPAASAAPQPPESAPMTQPPAGLTESTAAVQVVLDYYIAIAQKQYDQAYGLWAQNGAASGQTRSDPSDTLVISESSGNVPHEKEARGSIGGSCTGAGSVACGFSQT